MSTGHKLIAKPIERQGRRGMSWTCECGNWHPRPAAQAPWGARQAPRDTAVGYIQRLHQEHAASFLPIPTKGNGTDKGEDNA